jgi:serine/threonine-protein kinase
MNEFETLERLATGRVGQQIGEFRIEEVLGVGSMASVFLGVTSSGQRAAIKVLHPYLSKVPEVRKRFSREGPIGRALATLAPLCEGIPQVLEQGITDDGGAYMAMDLLVGRTFRDRFYELGPLPVQEVFAMAEQVLTVLSTAHSYGIVHRDLKPENLHVDEGGRVKVMDFGIARVLDPLPDGVAVLPEKTVTKAGTTLGTADYMAPEQALGDIDAIDGRSDLFGLGATMFELLSGRTVFGDLPQARLVVVAATQQAPSLRSVASHLPPDVCRVVDRALMFEKNKRYPHAKSMRGDVRAVMRGQPPPK